MPPSEVRNEPANPPQPVHNERRLDLVFLILVFLGGLIVGCIIVHPLAAAAGAGVLLSFAFGFYVVAPKAGALGKQHLLMALAEPSEDEQEIIQAAAFHLLGNASMIAANPETRVLFRPIFDAFMEQINDNWEKSLMNVRSQRERGVGRFSPGAYAGMLDEGEMMGNLKADLIGNFIEPVLDSFGFEGQSRENARNVVMLKLMAAGNGGQPALPPSRPQQQAGQQQGGGW